MPYPLAAATSDPKRKAQTQMTVQPRRRLPLAIPGVPMEDPAPPELREPERWQRGLGTLSFFLSICAFPQSCEFSP